MGKAEVKTIDDLVGPGAPDGTVPTDLEQSTGLERLELLGKLEGKDIFDMKPLDSSRKGTHSTPTPGSSLEGELLMARRHHGGPHHSQVCGR